MARILILQERPSPFSALQKSLENEHDLTIVPTLEEAMEQLNTNWFDLIISRAHLSTDTVFGFLNCVKQDRRLRQIPFICFCGKLREHALDLDPATTKGGPAYTADRFISLLEYCCNGRCDFAALGLAIETCLRADLQSMPFGKLEEAPEQNKNKFGTGEMRIR